jgi:hypothetical protein
MNLPAGLIFYLDFQYGSGASSFKAVSESLYGATSDLKRTDGAFNKGLYGAGEFAYSINTSSLDTLTFKGSNATPTTGTYNTGSVNFNTILNLDTEFSASHAGEFDNDHANTNGNGDQLKVVSVSTASLVNPDFDAIRSWELFSGSTEGLSGNKTQLTTFPQFTRLNAAGMVEFVVKGNMADSELEGDTNSAMASGDLRMAYVTTADNLDDRGDFEDTFPAAGSGAVSTLEIPEINVQLRSDTVAAKTRKLKAQWTPEFAQDLNAYHSIDAEAELTSILSEYISMEIDLEILDMLIRNADTVEAWSAKVAQDISVSNNTTAGGTTDITYTSTQNNLGVYYTKMSWFQTLGVKLQKVSNLIHQKTLRGGANWMVVGPKVSTVLESIPGFAADSAGDSDKYNMGVQKMGAINNRYTVYKNPYITENIILMGYKGSQFLETGAVFAPYIPLIMTPLVYDPTSFTPRKGIMTRYAKKMVRPDFYGKVYIEDLNEL